MPLDTLPRHSDAFVDGVAAFTGFGTRTSVEVRDGITYLENEFWTARQRAAHSLHEVSYRGCFKPQLPAFFLERLTSRGDAVLDPFMGRGTTPLQAALAGRVAFGNDINPLSGMLLAPRLRPPPARQVEDRLRDVPKAPRAPVDDDLLAFFHPDTLAEIAALREWLMDRDAAGVLDPVDGWIRMVAMNRLTGHSSGFLSGYTLPPNLAVPVERQRRINELRGLVPPRRDVAAVLMKKTRSLLKDGAPPAGPEAHLGTGSAARMDWIPDGRIDLVVTSPPFLDTIDYAQDNWLRCWFAGIDASTLGISVHRGIERWSTMIRDTLAELARVTRPGGHVAFEVGEVRNGRVPLERLVWAAAEGLPFHRLAVIVNRQDFTKTAHIWGVANGFERSRPQATPQRRGGTNTNRIVVLRRA